MKWFEKIEKTFDFNCDDLMSWDKLMNEIKKAFKK
jgi:hypothetical protein